MTIITKLSEDILRLSAYSYQESEFAIVRNFFNQHDFRANEQVINRDRDDRKGIEFSIRSFVNINRFARLLGLSISNQRGDTNVDLTKGPSSPGEQPYCCMRLSMNVFDKGCADILAPDNAAAFVKCAILAGKLHWFGAESIEGRCKR